MADFSKVTIDGVTYNVKDATARDAIAALEGGSYFIGVTTTPLTDGSTTNPIQVGGQSVTAKNGNIAIYGQKEFVWYAAQNKWVEFGDLSTLGQMAYVDKAKANYTPKGTIDPITVSGDIDISQSGIQTTDIPVLTGLGTLPSLSFDSASETLTFNPGTLPTKDTTDAKAITGITLNASFTGTPVTPVFKGTAEDIISAPDSSS